MSDRMKPEDVPDDIVEAAARAAWDGRQSSFLPYLGDLQIIEWEELVKDAPSVADGHRKDASHHLAAVYREVQARGLEEAKRAWQGGEWADAPRRPDRIQERIANGQHVGEWLSARAAALRTPESGVGGGERG